MGNTARNESYYDGAYASGSLIKVLIKLHLSYDQLSKTRRNLAALKSDLKSPGPLSVLDYGFGHGTFMYRVPRTHKVFGCELSTQAIGNMKRLFKFFRRDIQLFREDVFLSPAYEKKFDLIHCSHVLEHVDSDSELLSAFHKRLHDGGRLLINVPINEVWRDPNHVREYCLKNLLKLLQCSGFAVDSAREADRWTAFILNGEYVSKSMPGLVFRILRLILALFPTKLLDRLEKVLPAKYRFQQLIVVAHKL